MALTGLFLGAVLVALAYASAWVGGPAWGVWVMIVGSALSLSAATALGAANSHVRPARVAFATIFLFVVIVAGFGVPMLLPTDATKGALLLGLPLSVAIEVYGVGLLPLLVMPLLFAVEFKAGGLDDAALAELRRRCTAVRPS